LRRFSGEARPLGAGHQGCCLARSPPRGRLGGQACSPERAAPKRPTPALRGHARIVGKRDEHGNARHCVETGRTRRATGSPLPPSNCLGQCARRGGRTTLGTARRIPTRSS